MSDPKKPEDKDIIAKADDEPQVLSDEQLEDADGGFSFISTKPTMSLNVETTIPNADTAFAGHPDDVVQNAQFLRIRPGRYPGL